MTLTCFLRQVDPECIHPHRHTSVDLPIVNSPFEQVDYNYCPIFNKAHRNFLDSRSNFKHSSVDFSQFRLSHFLLVLTGERYLPPRLRQQEECLNSKGNYNEFQNEIQLRKLLF